jgi:hypothetical protein
MTAATLLISAVLFHTQGALLPGITAPRYTTCPEMSMEEALKQNVAYMQVKTRELLKYATVKVQPKAPASCRCRGSVRVEIKVEGERVACATALNGHPLLQEAAVKAAMQWRFKENPRYDSVIGMLVFEFK